MRAPSNLLSYWSSTSESFPTFLCSSAEGKFSPAEFVEADAVRIITAGRSRNHVGLHKHISMNNGTLFNSVDLWSVVCLTSLRLKVISRLLQKKSQNSGYMSNTSSTSSLWILWRSQYVRARTSALDFPGRAYRLMGSPNISFFPAAYIQKHFKNIHSISETVYQTRCPVEGIRGWTDRRGWERSQISQRSYLI